MSVTHTTRAASVDEISAEMDRRGNVIEQLEARLAHIDGIYKGAIDNLMHHQRQLDADGIEVGVSRQALDEILASVNACLEAHQRSLGQSTVASQPPVEALVDALPRYRFDSGDHAWGTDGGSMNEREDGDWIKLSDLTAALASQPVQP